MKQHKKTLLITSLVILLPILAGLLLWDQLPAKMPSHWNAQGVVDGWASKSFAIFGLPLIMLAGQWLCVLGTLADPKKANHAGKILRLVLWIIPVVEIVLFVIMFATAMGKQLRVEVIMPVLMGVVFVLLGNYLPKCKQNYTIGIKLPWTLASEENWNKTHRFGGALWVLGGLVTMVTGFLGNVWIFLAIIIVMALAPMLYSYLLYRKGV